MSNKCCILVTHQLQHLRGASRVVSMQKGCIEAFGSYDQLSDRGICQRLLSQESVQEDETSKNTKAVSFIKNTFFLYHIFTFF